LQRLNLDLMRIVADRGSGFAFPSRTVYMAHDAGIGTGIGAGTMGYGGGWRPTGPCASIQGGRGPPRLNAPRPAPPSPRPPPSPTRDSGP
jgi:hypothetical protein